MDIKISHLVAAAVIGFVGMGGASLAFAQEAPTTTTPPATTAPDDTQDGTTEDNGRKDCDHDRSTANGSGGSDDSTGSSDSAGDTTTDSQNL